MTFKEAKDYKLLFGKHSGETLDQIAESDNGLSYLDWLVGQNFIHGRTKEALVAYLSDPAIAEDLKKMRGE